MVRAGVPLSYRLRDSIIIKLELILNIDDALLKTKENIFNI